MDDLQTARLVAAYAVLGTKGITRDRICVDARAIPYLDGKLPTVAWRTRIVMLSLILLDCVFHEHDVEENVIEKFRRDPAIRSENQWLKKYFGNGKIGAVLGKFLELRA